MADKEIYDIDELLAELHAKREEMEKRKARTMSFQPIDTEELMKGPRPKKIIEEPEEEPEQETEQSKAEQEEPAEETATVIPEHDTAIIKAIGEELGEVRDLRKQLTQTLEMPLVPVIQPLPDVEIIGPEEVPEEEEVTRLRREEMQDHPIFKTPAVNAVVIPETGSGEVAAPAPEEEIKIRKDTNQSTSVLNAKEDEESFKQFFGDTVIVEHNTVFGKKKQKEEKENETFQLPEILRDKETDPVKKAGMVKFRTWCTAAAALVALLTNTLMLHFFDYDPTVFYVLQTVLGAAALALNAIPIARGLLGAFRLRADAFTLPGLAVLFSLAQSAVRIADVLDIAAMTTAVSLPCLFLADLSILLDDSRRISNSGRVSALSKKYASLILEDAGLSKALCHDLNVGTGRILAKRRCAAVETSGDPTAFGSIRFAKFYRFQAVTVLVPFFTLLFTKFVFGAGWQDSADAAAVCAAVTAPFTAGLAAVLPLWKAQKGLDKVSAVLPGYESAEKIDSANCVVLEGRELFPKDKVLLHGIKTLDNERVDKAILYAASVLIHSCDTMAHMFLKVIQGKTDMLLETDSVVYEEGLGFSFWVDQSRVLVGRRELIEAHEINVPSRDYEDRYTKKSTRDAIYLAVSGKLCAMFVISYQPDEEMAALLKELAAQKKNIVVRTRDFILSPEKISEMYSIPRSMVSLVRDGNMQDLAKETDYIPSSPSLFTHMGSSSSFLGGMISSGRLISAARVSNAVGMVIVLLSAAIALLLTFTGSAVATPVAAILLFQVIWALIQCAVVFLRKI